MNEVIMKTEYSKAFDEKRKGLIEQSYYKYGPAHLNFATGNVDAMEEMKPAITEAVFEAMMANSNSSTGEKNAPTVEVTLKADNETLYKMVKKGKESYNRRYHIVEDMG